MKNISRITLKDIYHDEWSTKTPEELLEHYLKTADEAQDILQLVFNEHGKLTHVSNENTGAAVSFAHQLRAAKITKNGTACRFSFMDYQNGAEVYKITHKSSGWSGYYLYYIRII